MSDNLNPQQFHLYNQPPGSTIEVNGHKVSYDERTPNGDNGKPARAYKQGTYRVEDPEGNVSYHDTSPFRPAKGERSQRAYTAQLVDLQVRGGKKAPRGNMNFDR